MLCPAGFEDVVAEAAAVELPKFEDSFRSSGFVRARSVAPVGQLSAFAPATNVFLLIDESRRSNIQREARHFVDSLVDRAFPLGLPKKGSLRLRIHDDGQFASTNTRSAADLEHALSKWFGLRISRRSATIEIWLIRRAELTASFLAAKVSEGSNKPERGELRPEICAALARLEPLHNAGLVVDPFAGSGAIGRACLQAGARKVWLNDINTTATGTSSPQLQWTHRDFRNLDIPAGTAGAIVTDPPWGQFEAVNEGIETLYTDIGRAADTWLRPSGALVLLSAAPERAIQALFQTSALNIERELPVLINGRKATVIRARKQPIKNHPRSPIGHRSNPD